MSAPGDQLHVTIDASAFAYPNRTGIGRYLESVVPRLVELGEGRARFTLLAGRPICSSTALELIAANRVRAVTGNWPSLHLWQQCRMGAVARRLKADIHFTPDGLLPIGLGCPSVGTIHDMIWKRCPGTAGLHIRAVFALRQGASLRRLTAPLADSEATRNDLIAEYGAAGARVTVVPLGVDPDRFHPVAAEDASQIRRFCARHGIGSNYLLAVGNLRPHKNLGIVFDAMKLLRQRGAEIPDLVIVGQGKTDQLISRAAGLDPGKIKCLGFLADGEIELAYRSARGLVFPSLYEGFGLPILEAMASGIPVIYSNRTSLPEVAGEAGLGFVPTDAAALAGAIEKIFTDPDFHQRQVNLGLKRAAHFRWEDCASKVWSAILDVAASRPLTPPR